MPARIVVVHDEQTFLDETVAALRAIGHNVVGYTDTMSALTALEHACLVEVLITKVRYPLGQPHGIALARMAISRRPQVKILFTADTEYQALTEGLGLFIALPLKPQDVVAMITRILD